MNYSNKKCGNFKFSIIPLRRILHTFIDIFNYKTFSVFLQYLFRFVLLLFKPKIHRSTSSKNPQSLISPAIPDSYPTSSHFPPEVILFINTSRALRPFPAPTTSACRTMCRCVAGFFTVVLRYVFMGRHKVQLYNRYGKHNRAYSEVSFVAIFSTLYLFSEACVFVLTLMYHDHAVPNAQGR